MKSRQAALIALFVFLMNCSGSIGLAKVDFNQEVRPLLSDKCFKCHGPDEGSRQADLRLDSRDAAISGNALNSDDLLNSEMLQRILSTDPDVVMPPPESEKSLSPEEQDLFKQWIIEGAGYTDHWAFSPPTRPEVPDVSDPDWVRNPIDNFVLAKLDAMGIKPSPPAPPSVLVRRMHLDALGLPPNPDHVFVRKVTTYAGPNDESPVDGSFIDELMNSEHFGERWARWWLDAARYADSDGYEKDKPRSVWFYRDWVIDAMNADKPYDQFVIEQIAGDLLPNATQAQRVATGFLRNSMVNEEGGADPEQFRVEGLFDRIDAIGKAILGLTTQCAQCHAHKYDPLTHEDYYAMFASLNDCHEAMMPVFTQDQMATVERIETQIAEVISSVKAETPEWQQKVNQWVTERNQKAPPWSVVTPTDLPFEGQKFRVLPDGSILSESYAPTQITNVFSLEVPAQTITAFRLDLLNHPQLPRSGPGRSIYGTGALSEFEVTVTPLNDGAEPQKVKFSRALSDVTTERRELPAIYRIKDAANDKRVTGPIEYAIDGDNSTAWTTDRGPAERNSPCHAIFVCEQPLVLNEPMKLTIKLEQRHGGWNSDDNQNYLLGRYRFSTTSAEQLPEATIASTAELAASKPPEQRTEEESSVLLKAWLRSTNVKPTHIAAIDELLESFPETESQLVVESRGQPRDSFVFARGDFLSPTKAIAPGVPAFLNDLPESRNDHPRLKFAKWLVAKDAPTTARVIVNRIWLAYFGQGLVTTPEDFGYQSEPPSHPELLDWLATELMDNGWSLKHIHRLILNSATYQQQSTISAEQMEADPKNIWLARGPRFRVDAEVVRDIALGASGLLNLKIGGPSVYPPAPEFLFLPPTSYGPKVWATEDNESKYRRSLYIHQYRSVPYPALQAFDAPKGDAACVIRQRSNTPLQALTCLNEEQFFECARSMASRVLAKTELASTGERIHYAMQLCTNRQADAQELQVIENLLSQQLQRAEAGELDAAALSGLSPTMYRQLYHGAKGYELAAWIVVCRTLLNLDETITKE